MSFFPKSFLSSNFFFHLYLYSSSWHLFSIYFLIPFNVTSPTPLLPNVLFLIYTFGLFVHPSSSSPAHQPSHCSPERCSGPPGFAVMGARQRRPVPCALLHSAAQRTSGEQLDSPLCFSQPWVHLLHSIQVEIAYQLTVSGYSQGFICILFITTVRMERIILN